MVANVDKRCVQNAYEVLNVALGVAAACQRPTGVLACLAADCEPPDDVRNQALELVQVAEEMGS